MSYLSRGELRTILFAAEDPTSPMWWLLDPRRVSVDVPRVVKSSSLLRWSPSAILRSLVRANASKVQPVASQGNALLARCEWPTSLLGRMATEVVRVALAFSQNQKLSLLQRLERDHNNLLQQTKDVDVDDSALTSEQPLTSSSVSACSQISTSAK
jgi:hypothetical protein